MSNAVINSFQALSAYQVGQVVQAVSAELDAGKTSPPPRFTEAKLIEAMENAWRYAKTPEEKAMLKQTEGIGTSRTRGPVLETLLRRKLLESKKVGKNYELRSTAVARDIVGRLPLWLTDVSTTAKWEMLLSAIERGEVDAAQVLASQIEYVRQVVERARGQVPVDSTQKP